MKPEIRERLSQKASEMCDVLQEALKDLESFNRCDTPEKRDEWIYLVAAIGNVERWIIGRERKGMGL